ncbi:hypothetical protein KP509_03G092900 [Ceratopteris richardii]|uniref:RING-Gid-type domain-containing protein n=1 Tax=Ceratopteris richardii TaxID=49495 RepID=A0A8T2V9S4_CERRI|nr:hypothetical protein KP509_03G092900 [Ceratopteris richardii]
MEPEAIANGAPSPTPAATPTPSPASRLNDHVSESLKLEYQLMKVPFEHLKKSMRSSHRLVEKEMNAVVSSVAEAAEKDMSKEEAVQHLTSLVSRLQRLKRKLDESNKCEQTEVQRSKARLDHLEMLHSGGKEVQSKWNSIRVDRILIDYMLRLHYYDTASKLAEASGIQDLVDIDIFLDAKKVIQCLRNKDCSEALAWCAENKSKLKKSKLLFDSKQWDDLIDQFKQEFCKMYGMTTESLLHIHLQAGLSALKTPFCFEEGCTKEDPLSQESFRQLAAPLPFSKHIHSKLVCYITKEVMDEHNPPQVLPNGYVYSTKALEEMAKLNNGNITCPRTGFVCNFSELSKAYIS